MHRTPLNTGERGWKGSGREGVKNTLCHIPNLEEPPNHLVSNYNDGPQDDGEGCIVALCCVALLRHTGGGSWNQKYNTLAIEVKRKMKH